jgi:hypothetical protein
MKPKQTSDQPIQPTHQPHAEHRRTGKVARLARAVRERVNHMLDDGVPYDTIIQKLGKHGKHLTVDNLSEWKQGGHRDWLVRQQALALVHNLDDKQGLADPALIGPFTNKLCRWIALHLAATAQSLIVSEDNLEAKWNRLNQLANVLSRLRHGDLYSERLSLDREWLDLDKSNALVRRDQEFWKWTEREDIRQKLYPEGEGLSPETLEKIERELRLM